MSPLPAPIERLYSYTGFQQGQGDNSFPGTRVDADFDQTNNAIDALLSAIGSILRSDGHLANGSVTRNALAADIRLGLGASHPWKTGQAYAKDDTVTSGYGLYVCLEAHTASAAFNSDLILGRWELLADLSQAVVIAPGSIGSNAFADKAIPEPKLADSAASDRVIADGALRRRHAPSSFGLVPVGGELDYGGVFPPTGWLFCAGQAVSRTTYAELFDALTITVTANATSGANTWTSVSRDLQALGLDGAIVEGPGVQPGSTITIIVSDAIALSAPATQTIAGATYRILPWGRGDGASTFNVPDRRGRVTVGRDNMAGAAAGRLTRFMQSGNLNTTGGSDGEILTLSHLPVAMPGGSVTVSYPPHTYVTPDRLQGIAYGDAGAVTQIPDMDRSIKADATTPPPPQNFSFGITNAGGGQAHSTLQPSGVANRIIFAGV
ncbi:microcystin-dependent protein [Methylobacterium sp. RAS18]|nr:microcystin-dependent protein [Methylobacterium sp. RAS18]